MDILSRHYLDYRVYCINITFYSIVNYCFFRLAHRPSRSRRFQWIPHQYTPCSHYMCTG